MLRVACIGIDFERDDLLAKYIVLKLYDQPLV